MLQSLRVTDFILFDSVEIEFDENFTVISGETGAGKSILLGALGLLFGEDAGREQIRKGAERARVEGLFWLPPKDNARLIRQGLLEKNDSGELIIRREVFPSGRSRAFVNGNLANISILRELADELVEIHGQLEHQRLTRPSAQLLLLDKFAGLENEREHFAATLSEARDTAGKITGMQERLERFSRERELKAFQLEEIERAGLSPAEEEELEQECRLLENSEKIGETLAYLTETLDNDESGLLDNLRALRRGMDILERFVPEAAAQVQQFDSARFQLEEFSSEMRSLAGRVEYNPARLEEVRARLDLIQKLKRKYGPGVEDIITLGEKFAQDVRGADMDRTQLEQLRRTLEELQGRLLELAAALSDSRRQAAARFEEEVSGRLKALAMGEGLFKIRFPLSSENIDNSITGLERYSSYGLDKIEFLLSTNPGFPPRPLAEIASGGELSRVMLAVKCALAGVEEPSTMIFDEIDSGIGGRVGTVVGEYLQALGSSSQVIVITHLAQIAASADHNLVVEKLDGTSDGQVRTTVRTIDGDKKIAEIARMLAGDSESDVSLAHAVKMISERARMR